jgi:hypothetical protein
MRSKATLLTPTTPSGDYVGLRTASAMTGIPESTLRSYAATGKVAAYRTPSRRLWFKPSDLDALYVPVVPKHQPTPED